MGFDCSMMEPEVGQSDALDVAEITKKAVAVNMANVRDGLKDHDLQPHGVRGKWEATNRGNNASWNFKFHLRLEPLDGQRVSRPKAFRTEEASMMDRSAFRPADPPL